MKITHLLKYPIKSTKGIAMNALDFSKHGFINDRVVAVINENDKIVTGREFPKLLLLSSSITAEYLHITHPDGQKVSFPLPTNAEMPVKLFGNTVSGVVFEPPANSWISDYLQGPFQLIYINDSFAQVPVERGGNDNSIKAYSDSSPIHLINKRSVDAIQDVLSSEISIHRFRPNIVIDGVAAFDEDNWKAIRINGYTFNVQELTSRCIFTTIHPTKLERNKKTEPLNTLVNLKKSLGLNPTFGIGITPLDTGTLQVGQTILKEIK